MAHQLRPSTVPNNPILAVESLDISDPKELSIQLRQAVELHSETVVSAQLLDAVANDSAPVSIFSVWMMVCKSPKSIYDAMRLEGSIFVRYQAIRRFGRAMNSPDWKDTWNGFGGAAGLLELFTYLSVNDVETICKAMGCAKASLPSDKAAAITELVRGLLPWHYTDAFPQSSDGRSLAACYNSLLPACTTAFVVEVISRTDHPLKKGFPTKRLVRNHVAGVKQYVLDAIFNNGPVGYSLPEYFALLLWDIPELPGSQSRMSASMSFSLEVLHHLAEDPQASCNPTREEALARLIRNPKASFGLDADYITKVLLRRAKRRRVQQPILMEIISVYCKILEGQKELAWGSFQDEFFGELVDFCSTCPGRFEGHVARFLRVCAVKCEDSVPETVLRACVRLREPGLRHTLVQSYYEITVKPNVPSNAAYRQRTRVLYSEVLPEILPQHRYGLLRRHHYHSFKPTVDIDVADSFKDMPDQVWPPSLFAGIPKTEAIQLLKNLIRVSPEHSFLGPPEKSPFQEPKPGFTSPALLSLGKESILAYNSVPKEKNFNAFLLLAMLEQGEPGALEHAKEAIEDYKRKAAKSREQSERASYAKAAILYAIASGSLGLYGDAVVWSRRFLRDALTMRSLVYRDVVLSSEGIDLLCGIPKQDATLHEASAQATVANGILLEFYETMQLAKKEPQFQDSMDSSFRAPKDLFGKVVEKRINRAEELQQTLKPSDGRVYSALWADTFVMLAKVESDFTRYAHHSMITLIYTLPPAVLFTLASAILDAANLIRTKEAQSESDALDRLSYEIMKLLVACDRPRLASSLVLRIIVERPEASSWHRQLLPEGLFKRLSARDAHDMLESFANAITSKMEGAAKRKIDVGNEPGQSKPAPPVKVTTVKYLAQLLDNGLFATDEISVDILSRLFKSAKHIDIRSATLESIVSKMVKNTAGFEPLFSAMESVVPISGSLNERWPHSAQAWEKAQANRILPEVWEQGQGADPPPLLWCVVKAVKQAEDISAALFDRLWNRILDPIVMQIYEAQIKWISLFADINGLPKLPPLFPYPRVLELLIHRHSTKIPASYLKFFQDYVLYNLDPPSEIREFAQKLREDPSRRSKPEYQNWLNLYNRGGEAITASTLQWVNVLLFEDDWSSSVVVSPQVVNSLILDQARVLLNRFDSYHGAWDHFLKFFVPARLDESLDLPYFFLDRWDKQTKSVIRQLMELIESMRSTQWKHDPDRVPSTLPSIFKLELLLLDYPDDRRPEPVHDSCAQFVSSLLSLISKITETRDLYPAEFVQIETVCDRLSSVQIAHVAYSLGVVPAGTAESRLDFLRVELFDRFYKKLGAKLKEQSEIKSLLDEVVRSWTDSNVEEFRAKAIKWQA